MSLQKYQNINLKKAREQGFTIVELLIVIIVIAILAALVISAYSGIQTKAKASKAQANAKSYATALAAAQGESSTYPVLADANTAVSSGPNVKTTVQAVADTAMSASEANEVGYKQCGSGTGAQVLYWDWTKTSNQKTVVSTFGTGC